MDILSTILIVGLGFAFLVLIVLFASFMKKECCSSNRNRAQSIYDEEESIGLNRLENNNEPTTSTSARQPQLTSPASAPALTDLNLNQGGTGVGRIRRYTEASIQSIEIGTQFSQEEMRAVQAALLRTRSDNDDPSLSNNHSDYNLIIGVYANSVVFCGYCVNLRDGWVEFYKIQTEHLPCQLGQPDNSEYEMRNFFFALMLWDDKIAAAKKFHIYIGNHAVNYDNNRLWRRSAKLLEHFWTCQRIVVGNDCRFFVSPRKDAESFAVKIVPAEDLSMENFDEFKSFISQYYGIHNFSGSHHIPIPTDEPMGQSHEVTPNYQMYIDKVRDSRMKWREPCDKCGYIDEPEPIATVRDEIYLDSS